MDLYRFRRYGPVHLSQVSHKSAADYISRHVKWQKSSSVSMRKRVRTEVSSLAWMWRNVGSLWQSVDEESGFMWTSVVLFFFFFLFCCLSQTPWPHEQRRIARTRSQETGWTVQGKPAEAALWR